MITVYFKTTTGSTGQIGGGDMLPFQADELDYEMMFISTKLRFVGATDTAGRHTAD